MRHDETRDNTTAIETQSIEADAHADTRETDPRPFRQPEERHEEHNDGANGYDEPDPAGVQLEAEADTRVRRETWGERKLRLAEAAMLVIAREHDEIVAKARQESEERANGDDPEDPEHDEIGDAETEYDIEYDDEPEDDGQPSEYEEWQDFMGGDEHYDHSENEMW